MEIIETITMVASVLIAMISLVATIKFNCKQQEHNANSVRPTVDIILGDYEDDIYVKLVNQGVGPAEVSDLICTYYGDVNVNTRETNILIDILRDSKSPTGFIQNYTDFVEDIIGRTISPGGTVVLVRLKPKNEMEQTNMRLMLKDIGITLKYKDIYETEFERNRKLTFFGRHF